MKLLTPLFFFFCICISSQTLVVHNTTDSNYRIKIYTPIEVNTNNWYIPSHDVTLAPQEKVYADGNAGYYRLSLLDFDRDFYAVLYPSDTLVVNIKESGIMLSGNAKEKHKLFHRLFTNIALHSDILNSAIRYTYKQQGHLNHTQWKRLIADFKDSMLVAPIHEFFDQHALPLEQKRDFLNAADIQMDKYLFLNLRKIYYQQGGQSTLSLTKQDSLIILHQMEELYNRCLHRVQTDSLYNRLESPYYDMIYSFLVQENSNIIKIAMPQSIPKSFEYFNHMPLAMSRYLIKKLIEERVTYFKSKDNEEQLAYLETVGFGKTAEALRAFQAKRDIQRLRKDIDTLTNISSLAELRERLGRDAVVSLWATYCAPCKTDFLYHDKVRAFLMKYGYEYVHISLDEADRKKLWMDNITSYRLAGLHVLASDQLKQNLQRIIYNGKSMGVPHTFIITTEGRVPFKDINFRKFVNKIEERSFPTSLEQLFYDCSYKTK